MKRKLIAANWKMNLVKKDSAELARSIVRGLVSPLDCDVVLIPAMTSLDAVWQEIKETELELGAQNVFWEDSGAYTGEVSPAMLIDSGCRWVIIGHSERRQILGETDEYINRKVLRSVQAGLNVILCIGETRDERRGGQYTEVINSQLNSALSGFDQELIKRLAVAYEPVWAIGTGENAEPDQIYESHNVIIKNLIAQFGKDAHNIRILYGGSVKQDNIEVIININNVDGALVGGASLDHISFIKIVKISGV